MTISSAQKIYYQATKVSDITKGRGVHTLRHFFASHLLEAGYDIFTIKGTVVHRVLSTTTRYLHVTEAGLRAICSPLNTSGFSSSKQNARSCTNLLAQKGWREACGPSGRWPISCACMATITVGPMACRLLRHALPNGFMRIRYFGFFANVSKKHTIIPVCQCLGQTVQLPKKAVLSVQQMILRLTGIDISRCPHCKSGTMLVIAQLPKISV